MRPAVAGTWLAILGPLALLFKPIRGQLAAPSRRRSPNER